MNKNMPQSVKPKAPNSYPMDQANADDGQTGSEVGSFNMGDHPELKGVQPGDPIKGSWEGSVESVDGDTVKVKYDSVNLETKNPADKEMAGLMDRGNQSMDKGENSQDDEY